MQQIRIPIYYTQFDTALSAEKWDRLMNELPVSLQEKVIQHVSWQDQHRSLFGKLLLKKALGVAGFHSRNLDQLKYTPLGRPWLNEKIDFNLSHSGELVVCAFSNGCRIGIDVEQVRKIDFEHFSGVMTPLQWSLVKQSKDQMVEFFRLWTLKESVIKANGAGVSIELDRLETDYKTVVMEEDTWHLQELNIKGGHCGFLSANVPNYQFSLIEVHF